MARRPSQVDGANPLYHERLFALDHQSMRWRTSLVSLLALMAFTACGDESTPSGTDATTTSTVESVEPSGADGSTVSATDPPPPTTSQADEAPSTTELPPATTPPTSAESTTAPPTTEESATAACTSDAILPVVAAVFPDNEFWNIVEVDVLECQNGYARVIAFPDQSVCDPEFPNCLENEQVFLVDVGGSWQYLEAGTGIECRNPSGLSPELILACEALGVT